jgi:hypothetical protein
LDVSVVVPVYNEEESVPLLIQEIHQALRPTGKTYEIILVDDGSKDRSDAVLRALTIEDRTLRVVQFRRNFGQTAALQAGLDASRGHAVVLMDADVQNDPREIPGVLARLDAGADLVAGRRADRRISFLNRRQPSMIAHRIIRMTTQVRLHGHGCTLKAMRREVAKVLRLDGEMHRFIPAIANWTGVRFVQQYQVRPMQVFGLTGLLSTTAGGLLCAWLAVERLLHDQPLADRPLLLLGILLVVGGVQLVSIGLVADMVARTDHESQSKPCHRVRQRIDGPALVSPNTDLAEEAHVALD